MIRLIVVGAGGRMGESVIRLAGSRDDLSVIACLEGADHPGLGNVCTYAPGLPLMTDRWPDSVPEPAVIVDFSSVEALEGTAREAVRLAVPWVCGVTGLEDRRLLEAAAGRIPVLHAPNMSLGVNLLFALVGWLTDHLPSGFDAELVETHHRRKRDAPSGTARRLLEILSGRRAARPVHGRHGKVGARGSDEVGVHALRMGGVVGEHFLHLASDEEELILGHRALDRSVFSRGALEAARWILRQQPGLYGMEDVLGIA